jgi:hypothetical protein
MEDNKKAEFYIQVSATDATEDELDRMTRQLLSELRETDVDHAELAKGGDIPLGAKAGEAASMGTLIVSALPTVLPAVITLVQSWAVRSPGRTVKFRGKGIEFEGSPEELYKLLEALEKQKKKRK